MAPISQFETVSILKSLLLVKVCYEVPAEKYSVVDVSILLLAQEFL